MNTVRLKRDTYATLFSLVLMAATTTALASVIPADFAGSWNTKLYGDLDISDGGQITEQGDATIKLSVGTPSPLDLSLTSGSNELQTPLDIAPHCCAVLPARNVPFPGSWSDMGSNLVDTVVVSSGNTMALGVVGQEASAADNTAFLYAAWQKTGVPITRDDFLGNWNVNLELNNLNIKFESGGFVFEQNLGVVNIMRGSRDDTILFGVPGEMVELELDGNRAFLPTPQNIFEGRFLSLDILHGGDGLLVTSAAAEFDDETDISLGFLTMTAVPEPATLFLIGLGIIGISYKHTKVRSA